MPAHPSKDEWCAEQQQHCRECPRKAEGQNKSMQGQRVGDIALAGTERAYDCGRNAATHTGRCRVLDQHHKREGERHTRKRVRAKTAEKQAIERDALAAWDLINGRLVRPIDVSLKMSKTYWTVCPKATSSVPKITTFRDWLLAEAADDARRLKTLAL